MLFILSLFYLSQSLTTNFTKSINSNSDKANKLNNNINVTNHKPINLHQNIKLINNSNIKNRPSVINSSTINQKINQRPKYNYTNNYKFNFSSNIAYNKRPNINTTNRYQAPNSFISPFKFQKNNSKCYSACPPWHFVCTKQCMRSVWYKQEKWSNMIKADPNFRKKAFEYIPETEKHLYEKGLTTNYNNPSQNRNHIEQTKNKINSNTNNNDFTGFHQSQQNLQKSHQQPGAINNNNPVSNQNGCFSACPPWYIACTMQCMRNPWYKQQKWIMMIRTDPNFRQKALPHIPAEDRILFEKEKRFSRPTRLNNKNQVRQPIRDIYPSNTHHSFDTDSHNHDSINNNQNRFSHNSNNHNTFDTEIRNRFHSNNQDKTNSNNHNSFNSNNHKTFDINHNNPVHSNDKKNTINQNNKMNNTFNSRTRSNSNVGEKNNNFIRLNRQCFSACPPWFSICPKQCMNTVWYQQPRWKNMIKENQAFRQKALQYIPNDAKKDFID
ncbi:hypothetical protein M9Y10_022124 [Tritrichomonas musculus]|uniref:Uncharacterized protein n=1 Tax=Tritrichomonas musculus TaxID=1915356 RepID=A0ABR2KRZ4_9EUKA